tara:strand:+ start:66 stop:368 length:303 start_codon:yes stop_codon:yes gene_type:complete
MEKKPMTKKQVVLSSNKSLKSGTGGYPMASDENENTNFTRDKLQKMSDKELSYAENTLIRTISKLRKSDEKTIDSEVELCYVQDEIFRRSKMSSYKTSKK